VLLSSGDSFPHLIQKRRSQLGIVIYLLNCPLIFIDPPIHVVFKILVLVLILSPSPISDY
jgi:hypothetical protein